MKIAILIQCHKNPKQINKLIKALNHESIDIFIHVDSKSSIISDICKLENVFFVDDNNRVDVKWGTYSQVEATLALLKKATSNDDYDYYCLISGQDFPLIKSSDIVDYFSSSCKFEYIELFRSRHNGLGKNNNYDKRNEIYYYDWMFKRGLLYRLIRRLYVQITGGYNHTFLLFKKKNVTRLKFYFGSSWWCLSGECIGYILEYLSNHSEYTKLLKTSCCPDESFFQTLVMNSPYVDKVKDYLTFVDWSEGKNNPKILNANDFDKMFNSGKLFARKIDEEQDKGIIEKMMERIKNNS